MQVRMGVWAGVLRIQYRAGFNEEMYIQALNAASMSGGAW